VENGEERSFIATVGAKYGAEEAEAEARSRVSGAVGCPCWFQARLTILLSRVPSRRGTWLRRRPMRNPAREDVGAALGADLGHRVPSRHCQPGHIAPRRPGPAPRPRLVPRSMIRSPSISPLHSISSWTCMEETVQGGTAPCSFHATGQNRSSAAWTGDGSPLLLFFLAPLPKAPKVKGCRCCSRALIGWPECYAALAGVSATLLHLLIPSPAGAGALARFGSNPPTTTAVTELLRAAKKTTERGGGRVGGVWWGDARTHVLVTIPWGGDDSSHPIPMDHADVVEEDVHANDAGLCTKC
jgi:hypothetical protein